jgi:hypothetical protein
MQKDIDLIFCTWLLFLQRRDNGKMPPFLPGVPVLGTMLQYNKDPKKFVTENGSKVRQGRNLVALGKGRNVISLAVQFGVYTIDLAGRDAVLLTDRKALEQYYAAPEYVDFFIYLFFLSPKFCLSSSDVLDMFKLGDQIREVYP